MRLFNFLPLGPLILIAIQMLVALFALSNFVFGSSYLAFIDMGSDSYTQIVPAFTHLARELESGWPSAWSFHYGLGNSNSGIPNPFWLSGALGGPDNVLRSLIWSYLLRLVVAGLAFYWLLYLNGYRRATCIVMALSYSYCGFATVDGQWESMLSEFAIYPLILVGTTLYLKNNNVWALPLFVALAAYCGVFMFALGLFLAYVCICRCILSDSAVAEAKRWLFGIFPLSLLGLALAAPVVIHTAIQVLNSPRLMGQQSLASELLSLAFQINTRDVLMSEMGAFFHKDLFGIGNEYRGWLNYLEGPIFYVGMLPLLLLPQLWGHEKKNRLRLILALSAITAFILFPGVRFLTYGFTLPYFRTNNLWISLLLLMLAARALDYVWLVGVDRIKLIKTTAYLAAFLIGFWVVTPPGFLVSYHVVKVLVFLLLSAGVLYLIKLDSPRTSHHLPLLIGITALSAIFFTYPSFNSRNAVTPETASYVEIGASGGYSDISGEIISKIRQLDREPFYRIEKTFLSGSLNDAVVQEYFGVKSYDLHGAAIVKLFLEKELYPAGGRNLPSWTNLIYGFGDRFALNTLVGVKYMLSQAPLNWPGYSLLYQERGIYVYENTLAFPLGGIYPQQVLVDKLAALPQVSQDFIMLQAAVVEVPVGTVALSDPAVLLPASDDMLASNYSNVAKEFKKNGLTIDYFSPDSISGYITSPVSGILAFSIPNVPGWTVSIDGAEVPTIRVNFGFFGVPITPGEHRVSLSFSPPGLVPGLIVMFFSLISLCLVVCVVRRAKTVDV